MTVLEEIVVVLLVPVILGALLTMGVAGKKPPESWSERKRYTVAAAAFCTYMVAISVIVVLL